MKNFLKLPLYPARTLMLLVALVAMPIAASAASIRFDTPAGPVAAGDTAVVRAYLDTGGQSINVVDGSVGITGDASGYQTNYQISQLSVAGSAFTLWPRTPSLSADGQEITFTGGVPDGLTASNALLFTIVITARASGTITFTPGSMTAYRDDGKGTAISMTGSPFTLTVAAAVPGVAPRDELQEIVGTDTTPPAAFTIEAGQDPQTYDGKEFIAFQTTDAQSGIAYYEVKEGNLGAVKSDSPYVLQNQNTPETITVSAYDHAGNVRVSTYRIGGGGSDSYLYWIIFAGVLILCLFALGRILRPRRRTSR